MKEHLSASSPAPTDRGGQPSGSGAGGRVKGAGAALGGGQVPAPLTGLRGVLRREPETFSLFQLLRILERIDREGTPVGGFGDPGHEVARLSHNPSLGFSAREVESAEIFGDGPALLETNTLGLTGSEGVLPHPYSILILDRERVRDRAFRAFLDLFHHRLLSLFYTAWRKGVPELAVERGEEDGSYRHLLDLVGMGHEPPEAFPVPSGQVLAWYTGLLAPPTRSAPALEQLLSDRFDVPVSVEPFAGGWIRLRDADLCLVGEEDEASTLGTGAVVGDEVWDPHARIRIRMGPLDRARFDDLLPGAPGYEALGRLVRFFTHDQFEVELQLLLAADEVPGTVLGGDPADSVPLGWGSWIRSRPRDRAADETVLLL